MAHAGTARPEERYPVDFRVFVSWQSHAGLARVSARCVNLSLSGMKLETKDPLAVRSVVLLDSEHFGRMGTAAVRYCSRKHMSYEVGLQFSAPFSFSDPARRKILDRVLRPA